MRQSGRAVFTASSYVSCRTCAACICTGRVQANFGGYPASNEVMRVPDGRATPTKKCQWAVPSDPENEDVQAKVGYQNGDGSGTVTPPNTWKWVTPNHPNNYVRIARVHAGSSLPTATERASLSATPFFCGPEPPLFGTQDHTESPNQRAGWATPHSDTRRPFPNPTSGLIAVKVTHHLRDEVIKMLSIS
jgi:hypothetical protein